MEMKMTKKHTYKVVKLVCGREASIFVTAGNARGAKTAAIKNHQGCPVIRVELVR